MMKKGHIFLVTLSLLATTAFTSSSYTGIRVGLLPGPSVVKQGNNVTLWCELKNDSGNGVPVYWQSPPHFKTRTSNCVSYVKEKYVISCAKTWYNMTILNVRWGDKGKYRCIHTVHIGVVDLQVLVPVTDIDLFKIAAEPPKGINAELKCTTNCAYPTPKISWLENGQPFKSSDKIITTEWGCTGDKEGQKRIISTVTLRGKHGDKGRVLISCMTEHVNGEKKTSNAVDASTGTSSQSIKVQPGPVKVKQGNNVTVWCKLKNDSESRVPVHWQSPPNFRTRTINCVSYSVQKYIISCVESHLRWYNLTIVDVRWADKGKYRCISVNLKTVDLQVLVPVMNVSLTHIPRSKELLFLDKDNTAVLTCTTNCAYPAPNISWFENNQPFNGSAKVLITGSGCTGKKKGQIRTISMVKVIGKYVDEERKQSNISCRAKNTEAESMMVSRTVNIRYNALLTGVRFQNTSTLLPGPVEVKQGNNISLWCKLIDDSAMDQVPVHWQSPPKFTTRTSNCDTFGPSPVKQKYVMSCAESGNRSYNMTIMDVRWTDRGKYRCVHTRQLGIVELQVLVPVINVSLTKVSNSKDNTAALTCSTNCAYPPPSISWFENDQPFNGRTEVTITDSGCIDDKEGQKRTTSTVTVRGKYIKKEREESIIYCMAENVIAEKIVSHAIVMSYSTVSPSLPQPVMTTGGTAAAVLVPVLVVIAILVPIAVIVVRRKHTNKKRYGETAEMTASQKGHPDVKYPLLNEAEIDEENKVPCENIGTEQTDKKLHARLLVALDEKLKDEEVRRLIHLLKTAKIFPLDESAKCNSIYDVWSSLERSENLAIGEYDELSEWMGMLKRKDCVDVINDYKGKIKDYREYHQRGKSLVDAAINDDATEVRKLLSEGGDVDYQRNSDGWTALIRATHYGHLDIVDALLEGGAEVNKVNKDGVTALMYASQEGHLDVVDSLLKEGAEVNQEDKSGFTALMLASRNGHIDVVDVLLKKGAAIDKINKYGDTALMTASKNGHLDVVGALLKEGAAMDTISKDGRWTALKFAEANGHKEVVELLKRSGAKQ